MNITDYPRMKKDDRNKFFRHMHKAAYPRGLRKMKEISFEEFARKMTNGE